jgi:hypothetical protein
MTGRTTAQERLSTPDAVLTRSDLRELGWERRAIDAIWRACPIIFVPGYSRGVLRVDEYLAFVATHTYGRDRVRPT